MKVLIYTEYFLPISGGVQSIVMELARGLAGWFPGAPDKERIEVTVVTATRERATIDEGLPFRLVRGVNLRELFQLLRAADVVHLAGPAMLPLALGLALGKRVVVEHHGYHAICPNGLLVYGADSSRCPGHFMAGRYGKCVECNSNEWGWWKSMRGLMLTFLRRQLCRHAAANIGVSDHVTRRLEIRNTRTIYHGISDSGLAPRNGSRAGDHPLEIGYVGRLVSEKGLPLLLAASRKLADAGFRFRLTFVGDGPDRTKLEELARRLGLGAWTKFLGDLSGAALEKAVQPLQVVVMPSLWEETAGLAAIEQMMRGGVVVAADTGGLGEVVDGAGLKFAVGDSDALYSSLKRVLEAPSLAASLGSAARARAIEKFSLETMVIQHAELYRELLGRRPGTKRNLEKAAISA